MNDLDQFKGTYITECFELLEEMEEKLMDIDEGETDLEILNAIFRCAHSIKGGAGAFGFSKLIKFTHNVEALLDSMREGKVIADREIIDALLKSVDVIIQLVTAAQDGIEPEEGIGDELSNTIQEMSSGSSAPPAIPAKEEKIEKPAEKETCFFDIDFKPHRSLFATGNEPLLIIRELQRAGEVTAKADISEVPTLFDMDYEDCYLKWNIEVTTDKGIEAINEAFEFVEDECDLDIDEFGAISMPEPDLSEEDEFGGIFLDSFEDIQEGQKDTESSEVEAVKKPVVKVAPTVAGKKKAPSVSSIRVDITKVDNLVNMVGELVITQAMIMQQTGKMPQKEYQGLIQSVEELSRHTRELQEAVMSVRMQPVKSVFARMPRIVRDLSRQLGKDIRIETSGENTEIDKTVIEQLSDPLTHMIRNSIDHGIETPEERTKNGKTPQGVINLSADNSGGRIIIEIADDGAGISRERVLAKAKEKGLVAEDVIPTDEEIDQMIFMAGFSTAEAVTNVSGRGVGMDVVRRNIAELGGSVSLENNPGEGSRFTVSLPLTLAILDGMIIEVGAENYIIPINNIIESLCVESKQLQRVSEGSDVLEVRGEFLPILYLYKVFNTPNAKVNAEKVLIVLVESGRHRFGLAIDDIVGQQQVVIKSIEENSDPVEGVSGATILGDGNVSLILDVERLHCMADNSGKKKEKVEEAAA